MFEEFSSGYYLGRLYVEPYAGDHAVLDSDSHQYVTDCLYLDETPTDDGAAEARPSADADVTIGATETGTGANAPTPAGADRECPLVMKLGTTHFRVRGEGAVPANTLALPSEWLEEAPAPDERRRVLLAKREHAERLFDIGAV